jgi:hypothetical protein
MTGLALSQLKKRNNLEVFLTKWKNGDEFIFTDGQQRRLPPYHEPTAEILRMAVMGNDKAARLIQRDKALKTILPLSKLQKTSEFGGRGGTGGAGGGAGVANEKFLVDMLLAHMATTPVTIAFMAGRKEFVVKNVLGVQSAGTDTAGAKKSDVNLLVKNGHVPLSLKQEDAGGWESADKLFREAGTTLIDALIKSNEVVVQQRHATGAGDVFLNRVVAMESTVSEQKATVFGSDIQKLHGAVIVKTFRNNDVKYNFSKNRIEVTVADIYQTLNDIPATKKPIWVIRNAGKRKSLPKYPGLRTEMKIAKYAMTTEAREGRLPPLVIKLQDRKKYGLAGDIVRS